MANAETPYNVIWTIGEVSVKESRGEKEDYHKLQFKLNFGGGKLFGNYRTNDLFSTKKSFRSWKENPRNEKKLQEKIELQERLIYQAFKDSPKPFDGKAFKNIYQHSVGIRKPSNRTKLKEVVDGLIENFEKTNTRNWHQDAYNSVDKYYQSLDNAPDTITFEAMDYDFFVAWEKWCKKPHVVQVKKLKNKKGEFKLVNQTYQVRSNRTLWNYKDALEKAFKIAKEEGSFTGEIPFGVTKGKNKKWLPEQIEETDKKIIGSDVEKLKEYLQVLYKRDKTLRKTEGNLNEKKNLSAKIKALNVALFTYHANGASPTDICRLNIKNAEEKEQGWIIPYKRTKTNSQRRRKKKTGKATGSNIIVDLVYPYFIDYINSDGYLVGALAEKMVFRKNGTRELLLELTEVDEKHDKVVEMDEKLIENRIDYWVRKINDRLKEIAKELNINGGDLTLHMMRGTLFNNIVDKFIEERNDKKEGKAMATLVAGHGDEKTIENYLRKREEIEKTFEVMYMVTGQTHNEESEEIITDLMDLYGVKGKIRQVSDWN